MILWEQAAKAFEVGLHTDRSLIKFFRIKLFSFELSAKSCCSLTILTGTHKIILISSKSGGLSDLSALKMRSPLRMILRIIPIHTRASLCHSILIYPKFFWPTGSLALCAWPI